MSIDHATEPCGICGEQVEVNIDHCMIRLADARWYPAHEECCAESECPCETHWPADIFEESV